MSIKEKLKIKKRQTIFRLVLKKNIIINLSKFYVRNLLPFITSDLFKTNRHGTEKIIM